MNNTRNSKKYTIHRGEVKKSNTKQHISYKHTTISNKDEFFQRINITAETNTQKSHPSK